MMVQQGKYRPLEPYAALVLMFVSELREIAMLYLFLHGMACE